jgi:predicted  nucleic acid-binding Zn-ribbon protein
LQTQIEILALLQTLDREIKEQIGRKQGLLGESETKEREIRAKKAEIDALVAGFSEKEKSRVEKDRVFQEEGKKATEKRMRMNRIKNAKELQALQREIEQARQNNSELEEELIRIMQEIDGIRAQIEAKQAEISMMREQWQSQQKEQEEQIHAIDAAVSQAIARRQSIAAKVTGDLISRYELIFSRRGGTAVVEVTAGICQGCFMNIPPQLWNEIIRNEKLHLCPSCQRILFVKPLDEQQVKSA